MCLSGMNTRETTNPNAEITKFKCPSICVYPAGAVSFVLSLLEPDPAKRPSVRAAMEERWINEGYAKKPLHTLSHKNR